MKDDKLFATTTIYKSPKQVIGRYTIFINVFVGEYNIVVQDNTKDKNNASESMPVRIAFTTNSYNTILAKAIEIYRYIEKHKNVDDLHIEMLVDIPGSTLIKY